MVEEREAIITQITQLSVDVRSFHLRIPQRPSFRPGQFLMLGLLVNGRLVQRAYSLASPPHWENVELLIKLHPGGVLTPRLFQLVVGDKVHVQLPYGAFVLPEQLPDHIAFLAGGVGIAPILAMLRHLEWVGYQGKATLLYGNRAVHDLVHKEELERLEREGIVRIVYVVENDEGLPWDGEHGYITEETIREETLPSQDHYFLCGPPHMVSHMVKHLASLRVSSDRIHYDPW